VNPALLRHRCHAQARAFRCLQSPVCPQHLQPYVERTVLQSTRWSPIVVRLDQRDSADGSRREIGGGGLRRRRSRQGAGEHSAYG
jgi:hypothetical protein